MQNLRMSPQIIRCKGNNCNYAMEKPDTTLTTFDLDESYITRKEQMDIIDLGCASLKGHTWKIILQLRMHNLNPAEEAAGKNKLMNVL